jgi:predicted metal-dependent hydrolase
MKRTLHHGGITLEYEFAPKRVKNINLRVRSDGSVSVSAPRWVSKEQVEAFLLQRWEWLQAAQNRAAESAQPVFNWRQGEWFHLLGEAVCVAHSHGPKAAATLQNGTLTLTLPHPDKAAAVGEKWYDAFCRGELARLEEAAWRRFAAKGTAKPTLRLRWMTSRWGSCMPKQGNITLNKRLFSLPRHLAEYVLLHEYCHLLHADHQAEFYALLGEFAPNRKQLDQELKSGKYRFIR